VNEVPPPIPPRKLPYRGWWPLAGGVAVGLVLRLIFSGKAGDAYTPMMQSFILASPVLIAVVTVYIAETQARRSWSYYFLMPAFANILFVVGTLMILIEGLICAILIVPLFALVGGLAGLAMGAICRATEWPRRTIVSCVACLPLITGGFEQHLTLPQRERVAEREILVSAPAAAVWRELIDVHQIRPDEIGDAWLYRIGVPMPVEGIGDSDDGEHLRHITMGKGIRFDQVATEWLENKSVSWRYRFSDDSFPAGALDDHVRIGGHYFDLGETQYSLVESGDGTRLRVRMHYRVSTQFNWYAGPLADLLVGNFEESVLRFYARRAELAARNQLAAGS
jgi:hypothetical protein